MGSEERGAARIQLFIFLWLAKRIYLSLRHFVWVPNTFEFSVFALSLPHVVTVGLHYMYIIKHGLYEHLMVILGGVYKDGINRGGR